MYVISVLTHTDDLQKFRNGTFSLLYKFVGII